MIFFVTRVGPNVTCDDPDLPKDRRNLDGHKTAAFSGGVLDAKDKKLFNEMDLNFILDKL